MHPVARLLIVVGIMLVAVGLLWQLFGGRLPLGRLPGDIVYESGDFRLYVPIVTCLLLSLVLTLVLWLVSRFR